LAALLLLLALLVAISPTDTVKSVEKDLLKGKSLQDIAHCIRKTKTNVEFAGMFLARFDRRFSSEFCRGGIFLFLRPKMR
jgi:hypothetical protein